MTQEHPDDFDSPWKEALEQALPDFLALFFPEAHAGIEWRGRTAALEVDRNRFALVALAQLQAIAHRGTGRKRVKLRLIRLLYARDYAREQILAWFRVLDWMLRLPGSGAGVHCGADGQCLHIALPDAIHYVRCMKTITINVSEPVYAEFRAASKSMGRPTSELIREAMELYRQERLKPRRDLTGFRPRSAGRVLEDLAAHDDLLEDMLAGPL